MGPDNSSRVGQTANSFSARRASHEKGWAENISRFAVNATVGLFETEEGRKKFEPFHDASRIFDQIGSNIHGVLNGDQREIADEREVALRRDQLERARKDEEDARERQQANLRSRNSTGVRVVEGGEQRRFLQSGVDQQERLYDVGTRGGGGSVASEISPRAHGEVDDLMRSNHRGQRGGSNYLIPYESQNQRPPYPAGNLASSNRQHTHQQGDDDEAARRRSRQQQLSEQIQQSEEQTLKLKSQLKESLSPRQDPSQPSHYNQHNFTSHTSLTSKSQQEFRNKLFDSVQTIKDEVKKIKSEEGLHFVSIESPSHSGIKIGSQQINKMIVGHDTSEKNRSTKFFLSPDSLAKKSEQEDKLVKAILQKVTEFTKNDSQGFSSNNENFKLQLNHFFKDVKTIADVDTEFQRVLPAGKNLSPKKSAQDDNVNKFFDNNQSDPKCNHIDEDKMKLIQTFAKQIANDSFKNNINLDWNQEVGAENKKSQISNISVSRYTDSKKIDIKASGLYDANINYVTVELDKGIYAKFNFDNDGKGNYQSSDQIKYLKKNKESGNLEDITDSKELTEATKLLKTFKIDIKTNSDVDSYVQIRQNNNLIQYNPFRTGTRDPKITSRKLVESTKIFEFIPEEKSGAGKSFSFGKADPALGKRLGSFMGTEGVDVKIVKNHEKFELKFGENNRIYTKEHGWLYDRSISSVEDEGGNRDANLERKSGISWGVTKRIGKLFRNNEQEDHIVLKAHDKEENKYYEFKIKKMQHPVSGLSRYKLECTSISDSPKTFGHQSGGGVDKGR